MCVCVRACVSSSVRAGVCECACVSMSVRAFCVRMRMYVVVPMYVRLRICMSECVCLPFVSVFACMCVF